MKQLNFVSAKAWTTSLTLAGVGALITGCAEPQVEYVPVYHVQPAYVVQQPYPPVLAYQVQPAPAPVPAPPTPQTVVVAPSAPPPVPVEVIPVAPDPYYVWTPGYYSWNDGWIWIRGRYVARPRPTAIWVGGHWARHGHSYIWIGGGWR
jgi:hypothetical protein